MSRLIRLRNHSHFLIIANSRKIESYDNDSFLFHYALFKRYVSSKSNKNTFLLSLLILNFLNQSLAAKNIRESSLRNNRCAINLLFFNIKYFLGILNNNTASQRIERNVTRNIYKKEAFRLKLHFYVTLT